jgi:hypothetical protein
MSIQPQEKLDRINELWNIHAFGVRPGAAGRCLALIVDRRYVLTCGFEGRLAVSFGDNPFTPEMASGFVPPPVKPGKYLFGLHNVGISDGRLSIFDMWMDSVESPVDCTSPEYVLRTAQAILDKVSDEQYRKLAGNDNRNEVFGHSEIWLLHELQIAQPEHF